MCLNMRCVCVCVCEYVCIHTNLGRKCRGLRCVYLFVCMCGCMCGWVWVCVCGCVCLGVLCEEASVVV
jgi:hypothetical protein